MFLVRYLKAICSRCFVIKVFLKADEAMKMTVAGSMSCSSIKSRVMPFHQKNRQSFFVCDYNLSVIKLHISVATS